MDPVCGLDLGIDAQTTCSEQSGLQPGHADTADKDRCVLPRALVRASDGHLVGAFESRNIYAALRRHNKEVEP